MIYSMRNQYIKNKLYNLYLKNTVLYTENYKPDGYTSLREKILRKNNNVYDLRMFNRERLLWRRYKDGYYKKNTYYTHKKN
jgi:hypothetical protein